MRVDGLRLGETAVSLKSAVVTDDCMIETKEFGNLMVKVNSATFTSSILVTPSQEKVLKDLLAGTRANAQGDDLINAAKNGDLPRVKALLAAKADVNAKSDDGFTALMMASEEGRLDVVQALLAGNADANAKTAKGATALMMASLNGDPKIVRALLAAKADVNATAEGGATALIAASVKGNLEVVRALLAMGADVNARSISGTALDIATARGHTDVRALLVQARTKQ